VDELERDREQIYKALDFILDELGVPSLSEGGEG
jgi:hypothetical protein